MATSSRGKEYGCDPAQTAPAEFIHRERSLNERAGGPRRPPCRGNTSIVLPDRGGDVPNRGAVFDAGAWLSSLVAIGGGYALASGRKLWLVVENCPADELTTVMSQVVGHPGRIDAVRAAIERRQNGETA